MSFPCVFFFFGPGDFFGFLHRGMNTEAQKVGLIPKPAVFIVYSRTGFMMGSTCEISGH